MSFIYGYFYKYHLLILLVFIFIASSGKKIIAQPSNDDCSNAINLGSTPICPDIIFTNFNATPTDIGNDNIASCFNGVIPKRDVWFSFTPSVGHNELTVSITGVIKNDKRLKSIQAAIYRGSCSFNGMAERNCGISSKGDSLLTFNISGLTQGENYYLRIDNFDGVLFAGGFKVCVEEKFVYNIKEDDFSSRCSGVLFDSGGHGNDYKNDEGNIFTICPEGNVKSINFELEYYNLLLVNDEEFEYDTIPDTTRLIGDYLTIYNGMDTTYSEYMQISGNADDYFLDGYIYGGGVGYEGCLNNPCITVRFESDDTLVADGFKFNWKCNDSYCEIKDSADVQIETASNNDDILDYLLLPGVDGSISNIDCDPQAIGLFSGKTEDIGFSKGLILTNGLAKNAIGPNDLTNTSFILNKLGDSDLDSLSYLSNPNEWQKSYDGCIVELDVIPYADEINYKYVFGSEEYHEFVNNVYNDVFALFISGSGVIGLPELNNQKNMAIIPNTDDFVEINSINGTKNWKYYHSNYKGKDIQYDGLVWDSLGKNHFLFARQKVVPCETYHLKYAIADRFDSIYDSGVFIGELTDGRPNIVSVFDQDLGYFIDNCDLIKGKISISLDFALEKDVKYFVELSGNAIRDVDYTIDIPDEIIFLAGETKVEFDLAIIEDDFAEGVEFIKIQLIRDLSCGRKVLSTLTIEIHDQLEIDILVDSDSLFICNSDTVSLSATGSDFMYWSPEKYFNNTSASSVDFFVDNNEWIFVTGRLIDSISNKCIGTDSVFIDRMDLDFKIEGDSIRDVCKNSTIILNAVGNNNHGDISWFPDSMIISFAKGDTIEVAVDTSDFIIYGEQIFNGCISKDSVLLKVIDDIEIEIVFDPEGEYFICDTVSILSEFSHDLSEGDSILWNVAGNYWIVDPNGFHEEIMLEIDRETTIINLELIDEFGCSYKADTVIFAEERDLLFPNAIFIGDEKNNIFKFYKMTSCLEVKNFQIFNRWGEKVFDCDNEQCAKDGWDATYKGSPVSPGVYLYYCKIIKKNGEPAEFQGSLMVLK